MVRGSSTEGGTGRGGTRDRGRQGSQEQEARDKGSCVEGSIWGHMCRRGRAEVRGAEMSSHRHPHHRT